MCVCVCACMQIAGLHQYILSRVWAIRAKPERNPSTQCRRMRERSCVSLGTTRKGPKRYRNASLRPVLMETATEAPVEREAPPAHPRLILPFRVPHFRPSGLIMRGVGREPPEVPLAERGTSRALSAPPRLCRSAAWSRETLKNMFPSGMRMSR